MLQRGSQKSAVLGTGACGQDPADAACMGYLLQAGMLPVVPLLMVTCCVYWVDSGQRPGILAVW